MKNIEKFDKMMMIDKQYEAGEITAEAARDVFRSMSSMSNAEKYVYKMYKRSVELENEQFSFISPNYFDEDDVESFDNVARDLGITKIAYTNRSTADLRMLYTFQQFGWQIQGFEKINITENCYGGSGFEQEVAAIMVKKN